jgi:very-short-patch-repair endonuclease
LRSLGVSFAPLAVFIRGGENYRRIEPDFYIVKDGISMVVEIDGDTVHQESPAEAHNRITMLLHEGVHFERIKASDCETKALALQSAREILDIFKKIKLSY